MTRVRLARGRDRPTTPDGRGGRASGACRAWTGSFGSSELAWLISPTDLANSANGSLRCRRSRALLRIPIIVLAALLPPRRTRRLRAAAPAATPAVPVPQPASADRSAPDRATTGSYPPGSSARSCCTRMHLELLVERHRDRLHATLAGQHQRAPQRRRRPPAGRRTAKTVTARRSATRRARPPPRGAAAAPRKNDARWCCPPARRRLRPRIKSLETAGGRGMGRVY